MKLVLVFLFFVALSSLVPSAEAQFDECSFIKGVMNKLGREMSINRQIVAAQANTDRGEQASQALAKQTKDYRLAKQQYEKADCSDAWRRD